MISNSKNTALAFLLGAAAGGVAALLLAPTSGKELRRRIGESAEKTRGEAARLAGEAQTAAVEGYREATRRAEKAVDKTKSAAKASKKALAQAVAEGKATYEREMAETH